LARPRLDFEMELLPARQPDHSTEISGLNKQIFELRLTSWCPLLFPFLKTAFAPSVSYRAGVPLRSVIVMQSEDNEDFQRAQKILKDDE
jgi:hypothetical protein